MKPFLTRWLCTTVAVAVATGLTGIESDSWLSLVVASLVLGLVNALVRPLLFLLSLPMILVTLGFFILVLNALMLWFVGTLVPGFHVTGFWQAFFGALIISVVNGILSAIFGPPTVKVSVEHVVERGGGRGGRVEQGEMKTVRGRVVE